jgi:hypothetical protein
MCRELQSLALQSLQPVQVQRAVHDMPIYIDDVAIF